MSSLRAAGLPSRCVLAFPILLPAGYAGAGQGIVRELEPNDTVATANVLGGTNLVVRGNISPASDVDYYSFAASAGDRIYAATMTAFSPINHDSQLTLL